MNDFSCLKISEHITRIADKFGVFSYLVEGEKQACLLDTGYGVGNIKQVVDSLTCKPYFVILTHGHEDHAGGVSLFDKVYLNPLDYELYNHCCQVDYRYNSLKECCDDFKLDKADFNPISENPFLPLNDGDRFDLGNLHLLAIWTPGHTKGMTMILVEEERIILFGDACGNKTLIYDDYSTSIKEFKQSLDKIKLIESEYDRIIRNHSSGESSKKLLDEVIGCCNAILNHKDAHQPTEFENIPLFSAKKIGADQYPLDGSQGNILYRIDKA